MLDFYESGDLQLWLWFAGSAILGLAIAYGIIKAGRLRAEKRHQLDRETRKVQRAEDPQKN